MSLMVTNKCKIKDLAQIVAMTVSGPDPSISDVMFAKMVYILAGTQPPCWGDGFRERQA